MSLIWSPKTQGPGGPVSEGGSRHVLPPAPTANSPFLCPSALFRPSAGQMWPSHAGEATCFTQAPNSHARLVQKHPYRHTQKECFPSNLDIP